MTEPIQHLQLALEIIATISLALSGLPDSLALIAAFGLTSALRVLTILRGWRMPGWRV
jgi:hypothetical protein